MKKLILTIVALLCITNVIIAVPAHKGSVSVRQQDGTMLTLRLHGDEWRHFTTTDDGYTVVRNADGNYVYATLDGDRLVATEHLAHDKADRQSSEKALLQTLDRYQCAPMPQSTQAVWQQVQEHQRQTLARRRVAAYDYKKFKGLVILVQFNDKKFSREDYKDIITGMMNDENYTGYTDTSGSKVTMTGSVRDYFNDNSLGKFQPHFDAYGPYTVDFSQYDGGSKTSAILNAAINQADSDIDFSKYDGDGDGMVDMVYFVVAGNGANYGGNDERLFWPHRSIVYNRGWVQKDGVYLYDYASSVELYGYTSYPTTVTIDGIGTICHEFSHVLGLPDFYDADYEESGGESLHPDVWSVMSGGSYMNTSRTPVGYSLYERWSVGFADTPKGIDSDGKYTLSPLYSSNSGLMIQSPVDNEYFLLENRQKTAFRWDAYLPGSGMLVYRVDKTNQQVWQNNTVNNNPAHNYYQLVRAGGDSHASTAWDAFPGTGRVTELHNATSPANLKTWDGHSTKWGLSNIAMTNGVITFDVANTYVLTSITLPESLSLGVGVNTTLAVEATPSFAEYTLTWASDNTSVATVDQNGVVTGVAAGTCVVTVTSDNGCSARCVVTVTELPIYSVGDFKQLPDDTEARLQFADAEVLYVYNNTMYVRDAAGGAIMLADMNLGLQRNDIVAGEIVARKAAKNNMPQAVGMGTSTNASKLTITAGAEVLPREVKLDDLTEADYSDYVLVKAAKLVRDGGVWATEGEARARVWNMFQISISLKNYENNYFDIPAIYGTDVLSGSVINELYMLASPVQVDDPTGIMMIENSSHKATPLYRLDGMPAPSDGKGIVISNGKKIVKR